MSAFYFGQLRIPVATVYGQCEPNCQKPCCARTTKVPRCPPGCQKPCCVQTVASTKTTICPPNCQKPCCIQKTTTVAATTTTIVENCPPNCQKPCCLQKTTTVAATTTTTVTNCPPNCQKPCCVTVVDFVALGPCCDIDGCNGACRGGALMQPVCTIRPWEIANSITPGCNIIPTHAQPASEWGQCFAPLYNRAWSLNPGIHERNLITNSLPDPRLYVSSLNNLTRTYAGWLREFHHVKDSNMRSLNYKGHCG